MSAEHKKGYAGEKPVQDYLRQIAPDCYRPRAGSSQDIGDIVGLPLVVSVKNHANYGGRLSGWTSDLMGMVHHAGVETGVVWHKRTGRSQPEDWYVTTTGGLLLPMLKVYMEHR